MRMSQHQLDLWRKLQAVFHQDFDLDCESLEQAARLSAECFSSSEKGPMSRVVRALMGQSSSELSGDWNRGQFDIQLRGADIRMFLELLDAELKFGGEQRGN